MMADKNTDQNKLRFKIDDATSYDAVVDYFDQFTEQFTSHLPGPLLEMANVAANGRVLDVGTGTGIIPLSMAERSDFQGMVVGIDLSDGMLSKARDKAKLKGLEGQTEFLKMDAENLQFPDNSFDAAISLYALHHFPNPAKALGEIYRVLKPGGSVVVAVGSSPALVSIDGFKAVFRRLASIRRQSTGRELSACGFIDSLVEKHIPERAERDVTEWVEHHHGYSGSVKTLVNAAGFTNLRGNWKGQYSIIDNAEDFWLLQMTFSSIARKRIQQADDHQLERLKSEFYQRCEQVLKKNGRLVYQTGAAIVAGVKPAHAARASMTGA